MSLDPRRHDHVKTKEEEKRDAEYKAKGWSWSSTPRYDYKLSGELKLKIDTYSENKRNCFKDTAKQRLEDQLNDFVMAICREAIQLKNIRARNERWEAERKERERHAAERRRQHEEEQEKN